MIVADSSALIAILLREPEADSFISIIAAADVCLLSSVSLLECSLVLAGRTGTAERWLDLDALIGRAELEVVAQDAAQVEAARRAFLRYGKGPHPAALNLGDCAAYALAKTRGLKLLFKGDDFTKTDLSAAA